MLSAPNIKPYKVPGSLAPAEETAIGKKGLFRRATGPVRDMFNKSSPDLTVLTRSSKMSDSANSDSTSSTRCLLGEGTRSDSSRTSCSSTGIDETALYSESLDCGA